MSEILVKTFDKEEYAKAFLEKGELLFRHVSYYQKIEDGQVRGDVDEGIVDQKKTIYMKGSTKTIRLGDSRYFVNWDAFKKSQPKIVFTDGDYQFSLSYCADVQICCLTYINGMMENIKEIIEEIKKFGNYCVVITDCRQFLEQLNKIPRVSFGTVVYSDKKEQNISIKSLKYKNQSEFRIVMSHGGESSLIKIDKPKGFLCEPDLLYAFVLYYVKKINL